MSFRASLAVVLGCQFGQASKLLTAAEQGVQQEVEEVLVSKPQLAAFTGFHGTSSPLHRASAAGHLDICRTIVELLKRKVAQASAACEGGALRQKKMRRWQALLRTVLDQRSHKSKTPLMLACEQGHADVAAYLLAEGADPIATDTVHLRTALHYAAAGGHAACVRLLLSDSVTVSAGAGGRRPARDFVMRDVQVGTARFIDQRSFGGLTALHFAAVSGSLECVQSLLRGGAAMLVKTDGEAFIGEEYLVPGSTPLHIAVVVGSVPVAHALLAAHMELMNVAGVGLDARGRRPWEGHSRTDIRSIRNDHRKLPFHLAREWGWTQLMHLVDPRVAIDNALDAARDTEHGIGPKRLSTLCSMRLQASLMGWLEQCAVDLESEAAQHARQAGPPPGAGVITVVGSPAGKGVRRGWPSLGRTSGSSGPATAPARDLLLPAATPAVSREGSRREREWAASVAPTREGSLSALASPFAAAAVGGSSSSESEGGAQQRRSPLARAASESAPVTPRQQTLLRPAADSLRPGPATAPALPSVSLPDVYALHRESSIHAYLGMLSVKRPPPPAAATDDGDASAAAAALITAAPQAMAQRQRRATTDDAALVRHQSSPLLPQRSGMLRTGSVRRALSTLRSFVSTDPQAAKKEHATAAAVDDSVAEEGPLSSGSGKCVVDEGCKDDGDACSDDGSGGGGGVASVEEVECGVCLDHGVEVAFAGCEHRLCLDCARSLTKQERKPPSCPFCRRMVVGFTRVSTPVWA